MWEFKECVLAHKIELQTPPPYNGERQDKIEI